MIGARLRQACERHGHRPAVETEEGRTISYRALLDRALAVPTPTGLVVLNSALDLDWVVAVWSAWLAGVAIAPLSPQWPVGRTRRLRAQLDRVPLPKDLAWVMHSSGSTGFPKAVYVLQRGVPALIDAQIEAFALTADARVLSVLSPAFDASLSDLLTTHFAGACLVLPDRSDGGALRSPSTLIDVLRGRRITHVDLPPALVACTPADQLPDELQTVVMGGEACAIPAARAWASAVRLVNVYGPTEATICTSLCRVDPLTWTRPLLGQPLPGVVYRAVDEELWISGDCLAHGYGDPALTAERFVWRDGVRWFRTGDRVCRDGDQWVFLGRTDRMVKLHGKLAHPEELERVLASQPGVQRAVAWAVDGRFEAAVQPAQADTASLLAAVRAELPPWMCPRQIRCLDHIPETASGKIDANVLRQRLEPHLLIALWSRALGRPIGWHDNLDEQGRDSAAVLSVCAEADALGLSLPPEQALRAVSCAQMAEHTDAGRSCASLRPFRPLPPWPGGAVLEPQRVLVTGATGRLGRRLLVQLQRRGLRPIGLVRSASAGLASDTVRGDIGQPRLGLSAADWDRLTHEVDTVVHLAADLHSLRAADALWNVNVCGTARVLEFVCTGRPKHLHHASTLAVFACSDATPGAISAAQPLQETGRIYGGYAQTKWAAEALVSLHAARGPTCVHRIGHVVGSPLSQGHLAQVIRGLVGVRLPPGDHHCNLTEADAVVRALTGAIVDGLTGNTHLVSSGGFTLQALGQALGGRPVCSATEIERALAKRIVRAPGAREPWNLFLSTGWCWASPGLPYEGPGIEEIVARVLEDV